ncbi:DbpA RNA binding domain-containing protein [Planctomycetes bacterium Poly30]
MTDAVEEVPLAQFKSAIILSLQEEEGLEMYSDLVKEVVAETDRDPSEIAAALARLARRAQEPEVLERIAGYEVEQAKPGSRARRSGASYDTNTQAAPAQAAAAAPAAASRPRFEEAPSRGGYESSRPSSGGRSYKPVEDGMSRLFISAGRMDGIRPGDLVGAIAGETGIEGSAIGSIDIFSRYSFVEVPERHSDRVVSSMSGAQVRGREVTARLATAPDMDNAAAEGQGSYRGGGGGGGYRGGGGGGYRGGGGGGGYRGGGGGGGYRGGGGGGGYRGGGGGGYRGGGGGYGDSGGGGGYGGGARRGGGGFRRGGARRGGGGGGGYGGGWADTGSSSGGGYDDSY